MNAMKKKNKLRFRVNKSPILVGINLSKEMTFKLRPKGLKRANRRGKSIPNRGKHTYKGSCIKKRISAVQKLKTKASTAGKQGALNNRCYICFP